MRNFNPNGNLNVGAFVDFGAIHIMGDRDLGTKLFIRSCYVDLFPLIEAEINQGKRALVLGTPGIGKSHLGFMILLVLVQRGETVVLQALGEESRILFSPQGVQRSVSLSTGFEDQLRTHTTYYIVDGMAPEKFAAKTILLSSPRADTWDKIVKFSGTFFYVPVWTLDELKTCRAQLFDPQVSEPLLLDLYGKWGGIPRFVLQYANEETQQKLLLQAIDASKTQTLGEIRQALKTPKDMSHKVVHYIPTPHYRDYTLAFASEYVAEKIYDQMNEKILEDVRAFLGGSMGLGDFGAARGRVFETYVHYRFERGGTFQARNLATGAVENLIIPPSSNPKVYGNLGEIQALPPMVYARPDKRTAKSIDALMKPNWLFQVTVSDRHPCREDGLADALNAMGITTATLLRLHLVRNPHGLLPPFVRVPARPPPRLYFVVPKDKFPHFGVQSYTDHGDHVLHAASSPQTEIVWKLEQWVLEVSLTS